MPAEGHFLPLIYIVTSKEKGYQRGWKSGNLFIFLLGVRGETYKWTIASGVQADMKGE